MNRLRHGSVCAVLAVLILSGCQKAGGSAEPVKKADWQSETPAWSMVSTDPEEFGIVYDEWNDLDGYALDKLAAYCLGADGIYAEEGFDQMYRRFVEAPHTWVTYVSLLPDEKRSALCEHTGQPLQSGMGTPKPFQLRWRSWRRHIPPGRSAQQQICCGPDMRAQPHNQKAVQGKMHRLAVGKTVECGFAECSVALKPDGQ